MFASAAGTSGTGCSLEHAYVFSGVLGHNSMPVGSQNGLAVVIDENTSPLPLRVTAPASMQSHLSDLLLLSVERLWQLNVRVALCTAEVHDEWCGALSQRGILLLHLVETDDMDILTARCGLSRIRLASSDAAEIRRCAVPFVSVRPLAVKSAQQLTSGKAVWTLTPSKTNLAVPCYFVLRASSVGLAYEYQYSLLRLLRVVEPALTNPECLIHGGLAFEFNLLRLAHKKAAGFVEEGKAASWFRLQDPSRASHLHRIAWEMLRAALMGVLEAFVMNLLMHGPPQPGGQVNTGISCASNKKIILISRFPDNLCWITRT